MSENEEGKVIQGGLVVSMRPQISDRADVGRRGGHQHCFHSGKFPGREHKEVCFPVECAREIADELCRLAGVAVP